MYTLSEIVVRYLLYYKYCFTALYSKITGIEIPANTDLNSISTPGHYFCSSDSNAGTITHKPNSNSRRFGLDVEQVGTSLNYKQVFHDYQNNEMYIRTLYNGGVQSDWKAFTLGSQSTWQAIYSSWTALAGFSVPSSYDEILILIHLASGNFAHILFTKWEFDSMSDGGALYALGGVSGTNNVGGYFVKKNGNVYSFYVTEGGSNVSSSCTMKVYYR